MVKETFCDTDRRFGADFKSLESFQVWLAECLYEQENVKFFDKAFHCIDSAYGVDYLF